MWIGKEFRIKGKVDKKEVTALCSMQLLPTTFGKTVEELEDNRVQVTFAPYEYEDSSRLHLHMSRLEAGQLGRQLVTYSEKKLPSEMAKEDSKIVVDNQV